VGGIKGNILGCDYDTSLLYGEVRVKETLEFRRGVTVGYTLH